jgi:hypothetical protein
VIARKRAPVSQGIDADAVRQDEAKFRRLQGSGPKRQVVRKESADDDRENRTCQGRQYDLSIYGIRLPWLEPNPPEQRDDEPALEKGLGDYRAHYPVESPRMMGKLIEELQNVEIKYVHCRSSLMLYSFKPRAAADSDVKAAFDDV